MSQTKILQFLILLEEYFALGHRQKLKRKSKGIGAIFYSDTRFILQFPFLRKKDASASSNSHEI